jgi:hypothetical protein
VTFRHAPARCRGFPFPAWLTGLHAGFSSGDSMPLPLGTWVELADGDREAFAIFKRHYSFHRYADGRRDDPNYANRFLIVGPGEKMVLVTPSADALFLWRKFIDDSGQKGVNCAAFRNEGGSLSSGLILAAEEHARQKWPAERFYTYVDDKKIRSTNPGACFKSAGWKLVRGVDGIALRTKSGKLILEKLPD